MKDWFIRRRRRALKTKENHGSVRVINGDSCLWKRDIANKRVDDLEEGASLRK